MDNELGRNWSRSDEALRAIFAALPDSVYVISYNGCYLDVVRTRGVSCEQESNLIGRHLHEIFSTEQADHLLGHIQRAVLTGETVETEYQVNSDGHAYWYSASFSPFEQETVVWISHDITDRKQAARIRAAFLSLGENLSAVKSIREVTELILQAADELIGWDSAFIDVQDQSDGALYSVVAYDEIDGKRQEVSGKYLLKGLPPLTRKTLEEGAFLINRTSEEASSKILYGSMRKSGSLLFTPIHRGNENVGVMSLQSYELNRYDEEDLDLLRSLAGYCSGALQRAFAEEQIRSKEVELQSNERRYQAILENTLDAIVLMDAEMKFIYASPSYEQVLGYTDKEALTLDPDKLVHPDDVANMHQDFTEVLETDVNHLRRKLRARHKNGQYVWIEYVVKNMISDPGVGAVIVSFRDISLQKSVEQQLLHGAYHDALTGLPNRVAFNEQLIRALAHKRRREEYEFAVLFLDLDRFKIVNDSLGHLVGDKLLVAVGERLRKCLREGDLPARMGGDEFAILLDDLDDLQDATRIASRLLVELTKPFEIDGSQIYTSASVGIAHSATGYDKTEDILRDADTAMYRAKALGKAQYAVFDAGMHSRIVEQLQIENDLQHAIEKQEFVLHYQPIVALNSGIVAGFEALVRWQHPQRGLVAPGEFIAIAEDNGLIIPLNMWVLREACRWMCEWQNESSIGRAISLSVNISARLFAWPNLVPEIEKILQETGLRPEFLKLEITEGTIVENAERVIDQLAQLKRLNLQLHVDDFGTGYSSLSYLHRFPIDALKIDRSFVNAILGNEEAHEISRAIVALAHNMKMDAIAEGVETVDQLELLKLLGCKLGQGYLFSKAVPGDEAKKLVTEIYKRH